MSITYILNKKGNVYTFILILDYTLKGKTTIKLLNQTQSFGKFLSTK